MTRRGESKRNPVLLRTFATLSVNSAKHLDAHADRPFAAAQGDKRTRSCCAQGDTVRQLRVMRIGADKSAVGTINRPLLNITVNVHHCAPIMFFLPVLLDQGGRWRRPSEH